MVKNTVHRQIKKLLKYRFLFATWQCYLMQTQFLCLYMAYLWIDFKRPLQSLWTIIDDSIFSYYSWTEAKLLIPFVAIYGVLMGRKYLYVPKCLSRWQQCLRLELKQKLFLLLLIISWSYSSTSLYLRHVDIHDEYQTVQYNKFYIKLNCMFCGVIYFWSEVLPWQGEVWPWTVITKEAPPFYYLRCSFLQFGIKKSFLPTVVFTFFNRPMFFGYQFEYQLFWHTWCLGAFLMAQLHATQEIYFTNMYESLPLVLHETPEWEDWNSLENIKLPLSLALNEAALPGFQLQAAKDLYYILKDEKKFTELFRLLNINMSVKIHSWKMIRDLILMKFEQFIWTLETYLHIMNDTIAIINKPNFAGMRPLMVPTPSYRYWSRRCGDNQPECKPIAPVRWPLLLQIFCFPRHVRNRLGTWYSPPCMVFKPKRTTYDLCSDSTVIWLIQALDVICKRSLAENIFDNFHDDLERILKTLLAMEKILDQLQKLHSRDRLKSCNMLHPIYHLTRRSILMILKTLTPHLDNVIKDKNFLQDLKLYK